MPTTPTRLSMLPFGDYWNTLPNLIEQGHVNPFKYTERMAVYKLLIEAMNVQKIFGLTNELNMLWGFASQLDWQWRSGRLAAPKDIGTEESIKPTQIAVDSWWGCCNYSLSIIPFIAAMRTNLVPRLALTLPSKVSTHKFAYGGGTTRPWVIPKVYEDALHLWQDFFKSVQQHTRDQDFEPLRFKIWAAHLASISTATSLYAEEQALLPKHEQIFGKGWVRMVDFLGEASWRTDMDFMFEYGRGDLPPRILTDEDRFGAILDMNAATNTAIVNIASLGKQRRLRFRFNRWVWKRAMRTRSARNDAPRLLAATFDDSPKTKADRKRLREYIFARHITPMSS